MRYSSLIALFLSILFSFHTSLAQSVKVQVSLSNNPVYVDEVFYLTYSIVGANSEIKIKQPQLTDFTLMGPPQQSTAHEIVEVQGRITQTIILNYTLALKPKKAGDFTIKGASLIANNGQSKQIAAANVKVLKGARKERDIDDDFADIRKIRQQMAQQMRDMMRDMDPFAPQQSQERQPNYEEFTIEHLNKNIFIRAEVDKTKPVVGEQVNVTYKLYTRLQMNMRPIAMPQLNGFWAQDIEIPDMGTPHQENFNGRMYNVFTLRKTALFPQQSGLLKIDPFKATGWINVFEKAQGGYYERKITKEIESEIVNIDVKPLPVSEGAFSNAVGKFAIATHVNQEKLSADDVIQLSFTINGNGNLPLIAAPNIVLPAGLSALDPELKDNILEVMPKMQGSRQFIYNINADAAGQYTIPEIVFTYFDTDENNYKTLKSPSIHLDIKEGSKRTNARDSQEKMKDILGIKTSKPQFQAPSSFYLNQWPYWLILLLPILGLGLAHYINKQKQNKQVKPQSANKVAEQRLAMAKKALMEDKSTLFYEEISKAIWLYLSDKLDISLSQLNKKTIISALEQENIDQQLIKETISQIEDCEMALYTPKEGQHKVQTLDKASQIISSFENHFKQKQ